MERTARNAKACASTARDCQPISSAVCTFAGEIFWRSKLITVGFLAPCPTRTQHYGTSGKYAREITIEDAMISDGVANASGNDSFAKSQRAKSARSSDFGGFCAKKRWSTA